VDGFDAAFPEAAGEDLDLGYRLARQRDVKLVHSRRPRAWHDHPHTLDDWLTRWHVWGRAMRRLAEKHPDPLFWPGGLANRSADGARGALARLRAQQPVAEEILYALCRLEEGAAPAVVTIRGLRRTFLLPGQAEELYGIGLRLCRFWIQKSFWEADGTSS
jgi:hypothetical protein